MGSVQARVRTADGPHCRGCAAGLEARLRQGELLESLQVHRRPAAAADVPARRASSVGERTQAKGFLIQVLLLQLCPKASTQNFPEYVALRECLRRGAQLGWPHIVCL